MKLKSIFSRLFIFFIIFTLILVGSLWTLQILFLPDYYQNKKVEIINSSILEIDKMIQKEGFSQEVIEKIGNVTEALHGRVTIFDRQGKVLFNEGFPGMMRESKLTQEKIDKVIKENNLAYITDSARGNNEFLSVLSLGEKNIYLFLTPYQEIDDAISITRGFYLFLFLGGILISSVLAYVFAIRISRPLIKLNSLAGNIAALNFNNKWDIKRQDEIGQLGISLNKMSANLEETLSDLEEELEKEKNIDKLRKNFVSRVSHELQTPIAIINGYIEALNDGIPNSNQEKEDYLKIIENETNKMSKLIRDLLDLSQLESGIFKIKREQFNYSDLLENKVDSFKVLLKEKNIKIIKEFQSNDFIINGDEFRIDQVLNNLIQNAINNCKDQGTVIIKTNEEEGYIQTEVFNEGEPILEEALPFIWTAFYKGEEKKGTGIGLAVVKNIIELHGGETKVVNQEDGVSFYFTIPK